MSDPKAKSQSTAFIAAAKAAECDEDEAAWDRRLKAVVKVPHAVPKPTARRRARKPKPR